MLASLLAKTLSAARCDPPIENLEAPEGRMGAARLVANNHLAPRVATDVSRRQIPTSAVDVAGADARAD